jgi:hypothetical protein
VSASGKVGAEAKAGATARPEAEKEAKKEKEKDNEIPEPIRQELQRLQDITMATRPRDIPGRKTR